MFIHNFSLLVKFHRIVNLNYSPMSLVDKHGVDLLIGILNRLIIFTRYNPLYLLGGYSHFGQYHALRIALYNRGEPILKG